MGPISIGIRSFNLAQDLVTFCILKLYLRFLLPPLSNINGAFFSWFLRARFHSVYSFRLYLRFYLHLPSSVCSLLTRVLCAPLLQGLAPTTTSLIVSNACGTLSVYSEQIAGTHVTGSFGKRFLGNTLKLDTAEGFVHQKLSVFETL